MDDDEGDDVTMTPDEVMVELQSLADAPAESFDSISDLAYWTLRECIDRKDTDVEHGRTFAGLVEDERRAIRWAPRTPGDYRRSSLRSHPDDLKRIHTVINALASASADTDVLRLSRAVVYGREMTGDDRSYRRIIMDTLGMADHGMLLPDSVELRANPSSGPNAVSWMQKIRREWLTDDLDSYPYLPAADADNTIGTPVVYGAFTRVYDDPVAALIAVGGFAEAADIVFASIVLSMKALHTHRDDFIRLCVTLRSEDGAAVLDRFLWAVLEATGLRGVALAAAPDIDSIRLWPGLPDDFVLESLESQGMGMETYRGLFDGLEDAGWNGVKRDFGMSYMADNMADSWSYRDRDVAATVMRGLSGLPEGFGGLCDAVDFTIHTRNRSLAYITKMMGRMRMSSHRALMETLNTILGMGDPQCMYRWMTFVLEQDMSHMAFVHGMQEEDGELVPQYDFEVSFDAIRSFFVGRPEDISGTGWHHANRRPPAEAMEYVGGGPRPRVLTYGRDAFVIPEPIADAFAELTPSDYHDMLYIYDAGRGHTLKSMILRYPGVGDILPYGVRAVAGR